LKRCSRTPSEGFEVFVEEAKRNREHFENPAELGRRIKEVVSRRHRDAKVYIFGSTARGTYTAASDIDVLVILPGKIDRDSAARLKAEVLLEVNAPIELHVVSAEEYARWYKRFIDERELLEIA